MLAKWNPFSNGSLVQATESNGFDELFRDANQLLESTLTYPSSWGMTSSFPAADIYETDDDLVMRLDVPGVDPKDIKIQIEGDVLTVEAQRETQRSTKGSWLRRERGFERVARSFVLPGTVDTSKCEATGEHGVLTVKLPKREEAKPRSITVKVQS